MTRPSKTDRATILAAAVKQVQNEGADTVAIRSVAAALGLAPNAIYHYFSSLAVLQAALANESLRLLLVKMKKAVGRKGPKEAIWAMAEAYMQFSREQPELFSLMFKPSDAHGEEPPAHLQSWEFVVGQVARLYSETHAPEAALTLWGFLHGMTVLQQAGIFGELKPASSFEFGLQMWIEAAMDKSP